MLQSTFDDESTLIQVMTRCRQAPLWQITNTLLHQQIKEKKWKWKTFTRQNVNGKFILRNCYQESSRLVHIEVASFNSLRPNDAIWQHISRLTLAQIMACCLTAPSHYLNQCWFIISKMQWHSFEGNFIKRYLSHQSIKLAWNYSS